MSTSTADNAEATPQATATPPLRPTWRFMLGHPAHWIALGFGSGLTRFAPGTVGTLWAWVGFLALYPFLSDRQWLTLIAIGFVVEQVNILQHII